MPFKAACGSLNGASVETAAGIVSRVNDDRGLDVPIPIERSMNGRRPVLLVQAGG